MSATAADYTSASIRSHMSVTDEATQPPIIRRDCYRQARVLQTDRPAGRGTYTGFLDHELLAWTHGPIVGRQFNRPESEREAGRDEDPTYTSTSLTWPI